MYMLYLNHMCGCEQNINQFILFKNVGLRGAAKHIYIVCIYIYTYTIHYIVCIVYIYNICITFVETIGFYRIWQTLFNLAMEYSSMWRWDNPMFFQ